ncbi:hypothetical protein BJV74DRAFT_841102, partial [Russula compacta]
YFTHLGVAFMNPGGRRSGTGTEFSLSETTNNETDELLQQANEEVRPALAHIVPNSVHGKPDTLKCIAMFAGAITRDVVMNHLNSIGNIMNMELNGHVDYDDFKWGIEAEDEGREVKYFFRTNPTVPQKRGPGIITLREGDEIQFRRGPNGEQLNKGPIARLCNLQLAVARVMKMSGAADIILEWKRQADDEGFPRLFISSEEFWLWLHSSLFMPVHPSPSPPHPPSATAPPSTTAPYFVFGSAPPSRP